MTSGIHVVTPPAYDWVLIIAFYAAVRYVNAYHYERLGQTPSDHQARNGFVTLVRELDPIENAYIRLYSRTRIVRYEVVNSAVNQPAAQAAITIAERVRDTVRSLL